MEEEEGCISEPFAWLHLAQLATMMLSANLSVK